MKNRYLNQIVTDIKQWGATFPLQLTEHAIFFKYYESEFPIPENDEKYIMHVAENIDLTNQVHRSRIFNQMIYMLKDRPERELILEAQYEMAEDKLKFCHFMKGLILEYYNRFRNNKKDFEKAKDSLTPCINWADNKILKFNTDFETSIKTEITELLTNINQLLESDSGSSNPNKLNTTDIQEMVKKLELIETNVLTKIEELKQYNGKPITLKTTKFKDKKAEKNFKDKFIQLIDFFGSNNKGHTNKLEYFNYTNQQLEIWLDKIENFGADNTGLNDRISKVTRLIIVDDLKNKSKSPLPDTLIEELTKFFKN